MIDISHLLPELELSFFAASSGPGGQHVNKVATAVMLRWNVDKSVLKEDVKQRLRALAGRKISGEGVLVLTSARYASQERNKVDVIDKFNELVRAAAVRPRVRRPTKPTRSSQAKRLEGKKISSNTKALRKRVTL